MRWIALNLCEVKATDQLNLYSSAKFRVKESSSLNLLPLSGRKVVASASIDCPPAMGVYLSNAITDAGSAEGCLSVHLVD